MGALAGDEGQFVVDVSRATNIDPRVLIAWIAGEGHPGDEENDWLNMGPNGAALDVGASGLDQYHVESFPTEAAGAAATINRINEQFLSGLRQTIAQKGTPRQQIAAIGQSGWATSHYGSPPGANLDADFAARFTSQGLDTAAQTGADAQGLVNDIGVTAVIPGGIVGAVLPGGAATAVGNASNAATGAVSSVAKGALGVVESPIKLAEHAYDLLTSENTWIKVGLFLVGGALVLMGVSKAIGGSGIPTPPIPE